MWLFIASYADFPCFSQLIYQSVCYSICQSGSAAHSFQSPLEIKPHYVYDGLAAHGAPYPWMYQRMKDVSLL